MTTLGRVLLVHVLRFFAVLSTLVPSIASGQITGDATDPPIVRWASPFQERTDVQAVQGASHSTFLTNAESNVVVARGPFAVPADTRLAVLRALDADTDTVITVETSRNAGQEYWLDMTLVGNEPYGSFSLARIVGDEVTLMLFTAPISKFADALEQAQQVVIVDDNPLFVGVDPVPLQALMEDRLSDLDIEGAADANATSDAPITSPTQAPTPEQSGLISNGSYVSPNHGFALDWTDEWILDPAYEEPVTTIANFDVDQVFLTVNSPQWVWFDFFASPTGGITLAERLEIAASSERLTMELGGGAEVVVSRIGVNADGNDAAALIIRWTSPEGFDFIIYEEYRLSSDGSSGAGLRLFMRVDDVRPGLRASEALQFEGGPVITLFTHDEVTAAVEEELSL